MRLRKDLAHAWVGYRQNQLQKDCPGCCRSFGIAPIGYGQGEVTVLRCRHCKFTFTLDFEPVHLTEQMQASRFLVGDRRANP